MKSKSKLFRPDLIVALLAVIIGVCTMFIYIYQANIMTKQMHASAWPHLQTNLNEGQAGISITVRNKGIGPAIVKSAQIEIDNKSFEDSKANIDSAMRMLTGNPNILNAYSNISNRVISANEEIEFFAVTDTASIRQFKKAMDAHTIRINISYCSVYGDCWTLTGMRTTECDDCE